MNVILTGSTGFIGSRVLSDLKHSHQVTAPVRDDNQAARGRSHQRDTGGCRPL
jgi:thioester reductase-like protein